MKTFDMTQCKPGDKLLARNGSIFTYIKLIEGGGWRGEQYRHAVRCFDTVSTRTDEGRVYGGLSNDSERDIIGFAKTTPNIKLYSIQDIRDMLVELSNDMNPYKFIDNAAGFNTIQEFLASIQIRDMNA